MRVWNSAIELGRLDGKQENRKAGKQESKKAGDMKRRTWKRKAGNSLFAQ
jgi:hypothetical protein